MKLYHQLPNSDELVLTGLVGVDGVVISIALLFHFLCFRYGCLSGLAGPPAVFRSHRSSLKQAAHLRELVWRWSTYVSEEPQGAVENFL
jgi:hypothetical protein